MKWKIACLAGGFLLGSLCFIFPTLQPFKLMLNGIPTIILLSIGGSLELLVAAASIRLYQSYRLSKEKEKEYKELLTASQKLDKILEKYRSEKSDWCKLEAEIEDRWLKHQETSKDFKDLERQRANPSSNIKPPTTQTVHSLYPTLDDAQHTRQKASKIRQEVSENARFLDSGSANAKQGPESSENPKLFFSIPQNQTICELLDSIQRVKKGNGDKFDELRKIVNEMAEQDRNTEISLAQLLMEQDIEIAQESYRLSNNLSMGK